MKTSPVEKKQFDFGTLRPTSDSINSFLSVLEKRRSGIKTHVDTGIASIDGAMPCLLDETNLVILAARPAMGKTSLGYQIGSNIAKTFEKSVFFFSIEMSEVQVVERHIVAETGLSVLQLRNPLQLSKEQERQLSVALSNFSELPLLVDETPKSIDQIVSETKICSANLCAAGLPPLGLILVDYLTIIDSSEKKGNNELEVKDICRKLKALAKEIKVPVLCLAQLNRSLESRPNKRPMLSDLRDSGAIEQEADEILFIYRDEVYNEDTPDKGIAEICAAKRRNFDRATVRLNFIGERMIFTDESTRKMAMKPAQGGNNNDW